MPNTKGLSTPAIVAMTIGGIFIYSAIKGKSLTAAFRDFLAGKDVSRSANANLIQDAIPQDTNAQGIPLSAVDQSQAGATKGGSPSTNRALGQLLAVQFGWGMGNEWSALDQLWTHESNWDNHAENPSSGAYGIAQAWPATQYPAAGQKSGGSDATVQIMWGLHYIQGRYGSPSNAWAQWQARNPHWY